MDAKSSLTFTPPAPLCLSRVRARAGGERHRRVPRRWKLATGIMVLAAMLMLVAGRAAAQTLPADEAAAKAALDASSRHGEYVDIKLPGRPGTLPAFVVYPERPDKAPVVILIHEAFGVNDWMRNAADLLAAEGFIAIAVDLKKDIAAGLAAARAYAITLPAANGKVAAAYYGASSDPGSLESPETPVVTLGGGIRGMTQAWPNTIAFLRQHTK